MSLIRQDDQGIYLIANGSTYRPGKVSGYDHVYNMTDGGLKKGDKPIAKHVSQSALVKITLESGKILHWHVNGTDDWTVS